MNKLNNISRFWLRSSPFFKFYKWKVRNAKKKKFTFSLLIFNFKDNFMQIKYNNFVRVPKIVTSKNPSNNHRRFMHSITYGWSNISQHIEIFSFFLSSSLSYISSPSFFLFVILEDESGVDVLMKSSSKREEEKEEEGFFVGEMLIQEWQVRRISLERAGCNKYNARNGNHKEESGGGLKISIHSFIKL